MPVWNETVHTAARSVSRSIDGLAGAIRDQKQAKVIVPLVVMVPNNINADQYRKFAELLAKTLKEALE